MLHLDNQRVRQLLLQGNFGLEKESLRITTDGHLSHTAHPFSANDKHIVRDFCENQTEINTSVHKSAEAVMKELATLNRRIIAKLEKLSWPELLWPFSNPPYINNEGDIPVAQFFGNQEEKTTYRNGLSDKYGRYKMTFSGIHFNYSFAGDLLRANYEAETGHRISKGREDEAYWQYNNEFYLSLAQHTVAYGWMLVALTAASPLLDCSYFRHDEFGKDLCLGMASVRCSELGYWNYFTPVLDYSDIKGYAGSIQKYVDDGFIKAPSELYYPVRLKPRGENTMEALSEKGVNHIELRCIDLNPLTLEGIDIRDVQFAQLMLVWLASQPMQTLTPSQQVIAMQNYKNASHFDLSTCKITLPNGDILPADDAIRLQLNQMLEFFAGVYQQDSPEELERIEGLIRFQLSKIDNPQENNYAWIVRREYADGYVKKGIERAKEIGWLLG